MIKPMIKAETASRPIHETHLGTTPFPAVRFPSYLAGINGRVAKSLSIVPGEFFLIK